MIGLRWRKPGIFKNAANTSRKLRLSALNSTKTAFASFACPKEPFFEAYSFDVRRDGQSSRQQGPDRFYCQILLKVCCALALEGKLCVLILIFQALLSIFRGRVDRNKDTAVERCDMEISEGPQQTECRLTVKMICGLGRLYRVGSTLHASRIWVRVRAPLTQSRCY